MKDGGKHGDSPTINRLWWLQRKDRSRKFRELLADLPKATNENLLVGFDSTDDAAVIKLRDDLAIIQTLDFSRRWLLIRIFSVRSRPQMH